MYYINFPIKQAVCHLATLNEWHRRLGHVSKNTILRMSKLQAVEGLAISSKPTSQTFEDCAIGKCKRTSHASKTSKQADKRGINMHFDTVGPMEIVSLGDAKYMLLCKDEFSYKMACFLSEKGQIPNRVKQIISRAELDTVHKVLQIVSDNGSEFCNKNLGEFLKERGKNHKVSALYTPQQNGLIEREVRTVKEAGLTMLLAADLLKTLWAEAMNTAIYVQNRVINSKSDRTPLELWKGSKPDINNLKIFGQEAIVLLRENKRSNLDEKGIKMRMVGYTDTFNTYRFYDPESETIIRRMRCNILG